MKYFTRDWCILSQGNLDKVKEAMRNYEEYWENVKDKFPPNFIFKKDSMHDSYITNAYHDGKNFIMDIDSTCGFTDICKIIFKNADIRAFTLCPNLSWEYTEAYWVDGRYDIQFLTEYGYMQYEENEIVADDIIAEREYRDYRAIAQRIHKKAKKFKEMYDKGVRYNGEN